MQDGSSRGRRHRRTAIGVIGLAVSALMLTACSSSPSSGSGSATTANGGGSGAAQGGNGGGGNPAQQVSMAITPSTGQQTNISPATPIVVKATNGTLTSVTVTNPAKNTQVTGDLSADKTTWTSNEDLGFGSTYQVDAKGTSSSGQNNEQKATITTLTPGGLANPNMIPAPGTVEQTGVGVGQPVVFQFSKPVKNKAAVQAALTVTTVPSQPGAWYWISSNEVHYRAQNYWQAGTTINVTAKIYGLDFGNGVYGAEDRTVTYHVHDKLVAKADGNTAQMQLFKNDQLVTTLPISMGKDSTPTHLGAHVIQSKSQQVVMDSCTYGVCPPNPKAYKATEYYAERISNDGEFVHENPNSDAAQGHTNVSHGCINLSQTNAVTFFNMFGIGDVVEVTNSGGPELPIWDMYGDWVVPWSTWQAGNANS